MYSLYSVIQYAYVAILTRWFCLSLGLLSSIFHLSCFRALLKKLPIIYAQYYAYKYCNYATVHIIYTILLILITRLAKLGSRLLCLNFQLLCQNAVLLFLTYYAQCYAHEKNCAPFCTKLWLNYHNYYKGFYKDCFEILPIMIALCLMLSKTHYAQNYAGIISQDLATSYMHRVFPLL